MKVNWKQHSICGIYCIRNLINNKVYIGKATRIAHRIASHKCALRAKRKKEENEHFINAWHKYGEENFDYSILEIVDIENQKLLTDRELYWITEYKSTERELGYNLRMDSSSNMIVHEETRKKISELVKGDKNPNYNNKWSEEQKKHLSDIKKEMYRKGEHKLQSSQQLSDNAGRRKLDKWKESPELRQQMIDRCDVTRIKYEIHQYSKDGKELVKVWKNMLHLIKDHPEYKKHNIYAVCSGEKPTMYGFKWVKVFKEENQL